MSEVNVAISFPIQFEVSKQNASFSLYSLLTGKKTKRVQ